MNDADAAKRAAAEAAVARSRTGCASAWARVARCATRLQPSAVASPPGLARHLHPDLDCKTRNQARGLGIPLGDFATIERLDLAIDGADEVERGTLRLIKGLGGALLREKIVAEAAGRFVILADASKVVPDLGARAPLPIEVTPFGHEQTARRIATPPRRPVLRLRDGVPLVSDGGNFILDCAGFAPIRDPQTLQLAAARDRGCAWRRASFSCPWNGRSSAPPDGSAELPRPG